MVVLFLIPDVEFHHKSPFSGSSTEAGLSRQRRPPPPFVPMTTQSLFVWSVLWFSIQRLHEAVFETHVIDVAKEEFQEGLGKLTN